MLLATVVSVSLTAAPCVPTAFGEGRAEFVRLLQTVDGRPKHWQARSDEELVRAFLQVEPALDLASFLALGHLLSDDACVRSLLTSPLERRAQGCSVEECRRLNGLIFRGDVVRAMERDSGALPPYSTSLHIEPADAGALRIQVVSGSADAGLRLHTEDVRVDPAAAMVLARGTLSLPVVEPETHTTFGPAGGATTWRSTEPLGRGEVLVACTNESLVALPRALRIRAVWQAFPEEGWTTQFEYRLPCAASFVVPAVGGIRNGRWRSFPLGRVETPEGDADPGPRWQGNTRVRTFGPVSYRETLTSDDDQLTIYRKRCTLEALVGGVTRKTELSSSYGCQLGFVADFNRDGLADVMVHMGHESCEHSYLFLSGPTGWNEVARVGSCE